MLVIPEHLYRGSSFFRHLESGFRLKACRNDNFFDFCKRLVCIDFLTKKSRIQGMRLFSLCVTNYFAAGAAGAAAGASSFFTSAFFAFFAFLAFFTFLAGAFSSFFTSAAGAAAGAGASAAKTTAEKERATRAATRVDRTFFMGTTSKWNIFCFPSLQWPCQKLINL